MGQEYYERPYELVNDQINAMSGRADDAIAQAQAAMDALKDIPSPTAGVQPLQLPLPDDLPLTGTEPVRPNRPNYPTLNGLIIPAFDAMQSLVDLANPDEIPAYVPPITTLAIPNAPAPIDTSGLPTAPSVTDVAIPTAPSFPIPELGNILQITVPTFEGLNLPTFTAVAPEFTTLDPDTLITWTAPVYSDPNLTAIKAQITTLLAGGTGIPAAVESALFDRSKATVDGEAVANVQEAFDSFAARGFDMPPGMLVKQLEVARDKGRGQANTFARDILIQSATWEIENLRFAVTQGIALETMLIQMFETEAARSFEVAKFRVEADIQLYNAKVTQFQALNAAYQTKATVFAELIRGELAKVEAFKAEVEAQAAIGQVNEQTVKVYVARLQGVSNLIEVYKAEIAGAQAQIEGQKAKVQVYGASIEAYAARVKADATRFDAYKTQVEGEQAKVGLLESSARAFAATVEGYKSKADVKIGNVRAKVEALQAGTQKFAALVSAERDHATAEAEMVKAQVQEFAADVQMYSTQLDDRTKQRQLNITRMESAVRNIIAYYEVVVKEYDASLARLEQESEVRVKALESIGQIAAQMAAGAMAAMHVSAQMSGSAQVSDQLSHSYRYNEGPLP